MSEISELKQLLIAGFEAMGLEVKGEVESRPPLRENEIYTQPLATTYKVTKRPDEGNLK